MHFLLLQSLSLARDRTLAKVVADKGNAETLRIAIRGMLPPNKLRARRLKLLTIVG